MSVVIGRDELLDEIRLTLDMAGGVVLVGPPGIGKSALAAALEPAAWVDLQGAHSERELLDRTADALGCLPNAASIEAALTGTMVFDAAEDLSSCALFERWALRAPLAVASRRHLDVGLATLEVGPLSPSDGAELMLGAVRNARRKASLPREALERLSERLDGHPLLLTLASARLRLYSPDDVAALTVRELDDPRRPARDQLVGSVRSSMESLEKPALELLRVASLLPGSFEPATLELAAGSPVDAPLLDLLDAALVHSVQTSPPRFRVLAPIREVARIDVDPELEAQVQAHLAAGVLPAAEAARSEGTFEAWQRMQALVPLLEGLVRASDPAIRLRAALVLAARERRTGRSEAIPDLLPELPTEGPPELIAEWLVTVATVCADIGHPGYEQAIVAAEGVGPAWQSRVVGAQALHEINNNRRERAYELATAAVALSDSPWSQFRLGVICLRTKRLGEAVSALRKATAHTDAFRRGQATYALCVAMREQRTSPAAVRAELEAIETAKGEAFPWLAPRLAYTKAILLADEGSVAAARAELERTRALYRRAGDTDGVALCWMQGEWLRWLEGEVPDALLGPAPVALRAHRKVHLSAWRAAVHAALGHVDAAVSLGAPAIDPSGPGAYMTNDLAPSLAVALHVAEPELAARLLETTDDDAVVAFARLLIAGEGPTAPSRVEEQTLVAIHRAVASRFVVNADGSGFETPDGQSVDISGRRVLRMVLAALAQAEEPLDVAGICGAVWPGERLIGSSGTRRVHVAISTLRGLGLRPVLKTVSSGSSTAWSLEAHIAQ